jgi:hypothetical protein
MLKCVSAIVCILPNHSNHSLSGIANLSRLGGHMHRVQYLLLVTLVFSFSSLSDSQTSSASLQGTVMDPTGSAIVGASIVLENTGSKLKRTATTGTLGEFRFLALPPGTYSLTITARGFAAYERTDLELLVNTPATSDVRL